jgi:aldehyde dehydrogenase (NAD+)
MNELQTIAETDLKSLFDSQQRTALKLKTSSASERIGRLVKLKEVIIDHTDKIVEALHNDYKKPEEEAKLEIGPITDEIDYIIAFLESWMKPQIVSTPEAMGGDAAVSKIILEPKGVCLFITPWNYPFLLTFRPLIACLAAGNTVIIKPSELTPQSSKIIKQIIELAFPEDEVAVIEGGSEVASELLDLPFNHIFYTGGSRVGKIIMKAAANHLSSVTLELGGKSPAIIDDSADFADAAGKIAWGKYFNCGQSCIAPDYILVSEKRKDEFVATMKATIESMYGVDGPGTSSLSYARLVNKHHYNRVKNLMEDAVENGANIVTGGNTDDSENYISPTLLDNVSSKHAIMKEEIFGPVIPVMTYSTLKDAVEYINKGERPLALYAFGKDVEATQMITNRTTAGASVVNHVMMHYFSPFLPFGGVGNSGVGKGHGYFGFVDFSNQRPVLQL